MKKFGTKLLALALSGALMLSFAACEMGGGTVDPTWQTAVNAYNAKVAEAKALINPSVSYERNSYNALLATFNFSTTNQMADNINKQTAKVEEAMAALKTADEDITDRINHAIDNLKIYVKYGETYGDKTYDESDEHPLGTDVWVKDEYDENKTLRPVPCDKDDEGAYRIPNKSVAGVTYDEAGHKAFFKLTKDSAEVSIMTFLGSGILDLFVGDFVDLVNVSFIIPHEVKNAEVKEVVKEVVGIKIDGNSSMGSLGSLLGSGDTDNAYGVFLAATLIALCKHETAQKSAYDFLSSEAGHCALADGVIDTSKLFDLGLTTTLYGDITNKTATARIKFNGGTEGEISRACRYTAPFEVDLTVEFVIDNTNLF